MGDERWCVLMCTFVCMLVNVWVLVGRKLVCVRVYKTPICIHTEERARARERERARARACARKREGYDILEVCVCVCVCEREREREREREDLVETLERYVCMYVCMYECPRL